MIIINFKAKIIAVFLCLSLAGLLGCGSVLNDTDKTLDAGKNTLDFVDDSATTEAQWKAIGEYFDDTIYDKVTNKFSTPIDEDGNNQVVILFFTMSNDSLGGYFWSGDFFSNETGSNQMEILYINRTHFNLALDTISHEFEHLVNASERLRIAQNTDTEFAQQSTWIDEGLAESAAHLVKNEILSEHVTNFNNGSLRNGIPLLKWNGNFHDYTQSYLFFQYIKNQASSGDAIFKSIIEDTNADYRAVEGVVTPLNAGFSNFDDILSSYSLANLARQSTGLYGYKDEMSLFGLNLPYDPTNNPSLYSGGILYKYPSESDLNSFLPSGAGSNIHFYRVNQSSTANAQLTDITIAGFDQKALVIVNHNTNKDGAGESIGTLPDSSFPSGRMVPGKSDTSFVKCASFAVQELGEMLRLISPSKDVEEPSELSYQTLTHTFN
ncbi:hypothetical protein DID80_08200, partial [Candidatus Marinamargulisbacteria bacterium SCGC AAA071-K20]